MIIEYANHMNLGPGDALPSENKLLAMLEVSRNTIRLAMERLSKMDYAVKVRGQGTFIKKKDRSVNLDFKQGFEGALNLLGIKVENQLVEKRILDKPLEFISGMEAVQSEPTVLIRRLKMSSGKILALEDRILPEHILARYTEQEIENENINPNLLEKFPDTETKKMKYYFVSKELSPEEAKILNFAEGTPLLQRIGEYHNSAGECFMTGRHIFVDTKIHVSYEYEKNKDSWNLT